ncbi:hypothetical protein HOL34_03125 [bacterium]|nr:hypothetical protein [bacterium]MBT3903485.1 hypothetical protein [bacterium]MBT4577477.1 hypothetical protein [bacterium]MBT6529070.1 hypothetical protein [bacterium]
MNVYRRGIVMRSLSENRIALFDKQLGRIDLRCSVRDMRLCSPGNLITYTADLRAGRWRMGSIILEKTALQWARCDFSFFCTILELCFFSVDYGSMDIAIFALVEQLYLIDAQSLSEAGKRIFLTKLFVLIGTHPNQPPCDIDWFDSLISQSPETMLEKEIPPGWLHLFDCWLRQCMQLHPRRELFKVGFL